MPVDYGYRDSTYFWYSKSKRPLKCPIPDVQSNSVASVRYASERIDPSVKFTDEACAMLVKVPRVFLKTVLNGCIKYAKEHNITLIDEKVMKDINDKKKQKRVKNRLFH